MEFDVFISYSRKDSQVVKQFVSEINNAGYKEWIDKKGISGGDTFQSKIVDAIDNSAIVLFFSSAESNVSQRVIDEICYAQSTNKTIIPIKLDDTRYNREFILRLNRINSIQYDADHPLSSYQELISSIEDKIGKPATPAPTKSPEELYKIGLSFDCREDYENAVKYYKPAAEQGHVSAQFRLGYFYRQGLGGTQDNKEGVKWYRKAAEQGSASAQYNLGVCYYCGYGVTQDYQEAVSWYQKAAEQGNTGAQNNLGYCYHKGLGVPQNDKEAVKWYLKAAKQGDAYAQNNLGDCYENGLGVKKDKQEAIKWYRKAAEQGNDGAIKKLKELEG